ncbi:GNAT family N-acetyltransferase [Nonomuraea sp. NPDC050404]|uniref:GNAT family N-acetyltransferase n=1 Tax=Nonomuraea sp. NPDC050404 TaxID=3155783 RepID=UPI0033C257AE
MTIDFRHRLGPDAAEAVLSVDYVDTYELIYSEPPYSGLSPYTRAEFVARTTAQMKRPGFELVTAQDGAALVGFCIGLTMEAGRWWGGATTGAPSEVLDSPKAAIIELILRKEHRGRGLGKRLLSEMLAGRTEPYATLAAHPSAAAHAMYERWGWQSAGPSQPVADGPTLDLMVLNLREES